MGSYICTGSTIRRRAEAHKMKNGAGENSPLCIVMLSEAKHLWIFCVPSWEEWPEILRSAQDDNCVTIVGLLDLELPQV